MSYPYNRETSDEIGREVVGRIEREDGSVDTICRNSAYNTHTPPPHINTSSIFSTNSVPTWTYEENATPFFSYEYIHDPNDIFITRLRQQPIEEILEIKFTEPVEKCTFCKKKIKGKFKIIKDNKLCNHCTWLYGVMKREFESKNQMVISSIYQAVAVDVNTNEP
jgi:hypothetical protein